MFDPQVFPKTLPFLSSIEFEATPTIIALREEARVSLALLNYALKALPGSIHFFDTVALWEAKASNAVDGIRISTDALFDSIASERFNTKTQAVVACKTALLKGFSLFQEKGHLGFADIESINEQVNTREQSKGKSSYISESPSDLLKQHLADMLEYVYDDDQYNEHPLIKIALAHCQFENVHPFFGGNGKTGRILNLLLLCQKDYLSYPILCPSAYINKNKNEFEEALQRSRETGDYTEAVAYLLRAYKESADSMRRALEEMARKTLECTLTRETDPAPQKQGKRTYFTDGMIGNKKALCDCIRMIMKMPYVRNCDLVNAGLANRQTAAVYLDQLADKGILSKTKVGKENIYKNIKLLELFEQDSEE